MPVKILCATQLTPLEGNKHFWVGMLQTFITTTNF